MAVFLIDPEAETIVDVEERFSAEIERLGEELGPHEALTRVMREQLGVRQLVIRPLANGRLALVVDNFGLLKPAQSFWRLADGDIKMAGKGLLMAVGPQGQLMPIDQSFRPQIEAAIVWERGVSLLRIVERVATTPGQVPSIVLFPVFSDDPEPEVLRQLDEAAAREQAKEPQDAPEIAGNGSGAVFSSADGVEDGWTVEARQDGSCRALRYVLADGMLAPTSEMLSAPNLVELRKLMPPGLQRIEPGDDDAPNVIELWVRDASHAST